MTEGAAPSADIAGATILIIEDEMLITMLLEDILDDIGCGVAGSAVSLREAQGLADTITADAAILDVNLGGDPVFPIAERLTERGIPIIFASGYGASGLPDKWQGYQTLPKPFTADQVEAAIRAVLGR